MSRALQRWLLTSTLLTAVGLLVQGCVCCSAGEYQTQCCNACCTVFSDGCVPLCIDTISGNGPLSGGSSAAQEVQAPAVPTQPTAVAY